MGGVGAATLLAKWNRLHAVRTLAAFVALLILLADLGSR